MFEGVLSAASESQRPVIILGTGGHAKVLAEILHLLGRPIIGVTDPVRDVGAKCFDQTVLGDDHAVFDYSPNDVELVNGIGGMPGKKLRLNLAEFMGQKGYTFSQVIHPLAVIAEDVHLGLGVQIMVGVIIQPGSFIGEASIVNTGATIDHDCKIGANCHLAPRVTLSGSVIVGDGVHIGTGSVVIDGISIGSASLIAAGSIIYKDIPDHVKYIQLRKTSMEKKE